MTARARGATLIALAASLFVAACQGGTAATNTPTQAPTAAPTAAPSNPGSSFALPSGFNADQDLEALLPDEIGGKKIQKLSMTGDTFMGSGESTEELEALLTQLGKQPSDLSVAFAGTEAAAIIAFRIKGVDANTFYNGFLAAAAGEDVANISDITIAGKSAKKLVDAEQTVSYLYLTGDALFTITALTGAIPDDILNEIFTKLP